MAPLLTKVHGATECMPDIFDDLAKLHRVADVIDDSAPADHKSLGWHACFWLRRSLILRL